MVRSSGVILSAMLLSAVAAAQSGSTVAVNNNPRNAPGQTNRVVEQPGTNLVGAGVDTLQPGMSPADVLVSLNGHTVPLAEKPRNFQAGSTGQTAPAPAPITRMTAAEIEAQAAKLSGSAKTIPSGNAGVTLEKYPGHFTMLTVRAKSGGAEMHEYYNDIFVVIDGEATEMTGGTIVDAKKDEKTGETRGTRVEGATPTPMRKGDIIHISPNVPHQTMVEPGQTFTYYVIKVAVPGAPVH